MPQKPSPYSSLVVSTPRWSIGNDQICSPPRAETATPKEELLDSHTSTNIREALGQRAVLPPPPPGPERTGRTGREARTHRHTQTHTDTHTHTPDWEDRKSWIPLLPPLPRTGPGRAGLDGAGGAEGPGRAGVGGPG